MKCKLNPEYPFRYFKEISLIPRKSFHEKEIADYLVRFAEEKGLWYSRDAIDNVIVKKPGSPGKENEPAVILQAHTDMVCISEDGCCHDFLKDPIDWYQEDGWLKARGTTLGADDGAGVAYILGILSEPDLAHPPLECVFTVQEEDGMGGANNLDFSQFSARRMIGLDGIREGTTILSASGVAGGQIVKKLETEAAEKAEGMPEAAETEAAEKAEGMPEAAGTAAVAEAAAAVKAAETEEYEITVSGLVSGHGALSIGLGLANAIQVAGRLLYHLNRKFGIRLSSVSGGTAVHVIPKECRVVFSAPRTAGEEEICCFIRDCTDEIRQEYQETEPNLQITCRKLKGSGTGAHTSETRTGAAAHASGICTGAEAYASGICSSAAAHTSGICHEKHNANAGGKGERLTQKCSDEILAMLYLIPVGPCGRKQSDPAKVESSQNLSMAETVGGELRLWYICRANFPGNVNELESKASAFAKTFGAEYRNRFRYSGFHVPEESPMIRIWEEVYRENTGKLLEKLYLHAGLDAGPIFERLGITDLIVVMPTVLDVHTAKERMDAESFARTYQYLKEILARI